MNTEDSEFARIEREQAMRGVPDAIHHTDTSETLEYITGWNDCRAAMMAERPAQQEPDWLTSKQRIYLAQAWAMLDDYALDQRSKGNNGFANGSEASSHEIKAMLATPQAQPAPVHCEAGPEYCPQCHKEAQPAQRTWVGLTDDEKHEAVSDEIGRIRDYEDYADAIEAKLRSKNENRN